MSAFGTWSQVEVAGKLADVFEPARPAEHGRVVLHLHGHSGETIKDNAAFTAELSRYGLRAICPHGKRSWWSDIVCSEFDETITPLMYLREQVVPFIASQWGTRPPQIGLMGISMGGQGVLQLSYRYPREFPVAAAIAPAVDFHNWHGRELPIDEMFSSREAARQQTVTLRINPLNWPRHQLVVCDPADVECFEGVERLAMKLSSIGIPCESDLTTTNGGHCWEYFNSMAPRVIGFVAEKLDAVSRTV